MRRKEITSLKLAQTIVALRKTSYSRDFNAAFGAMMMLVGDNALCTEACAMCGMGALAMRKLPERPKSRRGGDEDEDRYESSLFDDWQNPGYLCVAASTDLGAVLAYRLRN